MPAKIKLTYFNLRGRAEPSRLILAQAGIEYEDNRIEQADWPKLKPTTPLGTLPVLEYNGTAMGQSMAIARFLAKQVNLAGQTAEEEARADMIVDCITDAFSGFTQAVIKEKDETKKAELLKVYFGETLPNSVKLFDKLLKENGGGKFFVGKGLTWADILFANFMNGMEDQIGEKVYGDSKGLKALVNGVLNLPNIKKWIEKRPKTDM